MLAINVSIPDSLVNSATSRNFDRGNSSYHAHSQFSELPHIEGWLLIVFRVVDWIEWIYITGLLLQFWRTKRDRFSAEEKSMTWLKHG